MRLAPVFVALGVLAVLLLPMVPHGVYVWLLVGFLVGNLMGRM